ncbi:MAG: glycosyltransferase [Pseudomonadota bacterium]
MSRAGLKVVSLIPGCGYGDAAAEYVAGFHQASINVNWFPTRDNSADLLSEAAATRDLQSGVREIVAPLWNRRVEHDALLVQVPPWRWHQYWLDVEPQQRHYCYVAWEVETLPLEWVDVFNRYRRVFVPSAFNRQSFIAGGVRVPVDVVPHIARNVGDLDDGATWGDVDKHDFVFYTIGAWTARKAMEDLVCAYLDAFTADDPVVLVIKTDAINQVARHSMSADMLNGPDAHRAMTWFALAGIVSQFPNPARIHLVADSLRPAAIDRIHVRGDCFVSLARSEGWGLGAYDALLFGNPVVMTDWGGQRDFLGSDYPYAINYELRPTSASPDDGYYLRDDNVYWAHADRAHASVLMREVFDKQKIARECATTMAATLREKFSRDRVTSQLVQLMEL